MWLLNFQYLLKVSNGLYQRKLTVQYLINLDQRNSVKTQLADVNSDNSKQGYDSSKRFVSE